MYYLGIDIGTGGSRAVVINERGSLVASALVDHPPFAVPFTGWAEQEPNDWWKAASAAIRQVLASGGISASDIGGVGLSGQMHGSVLLDGSDDPVRPALLWCDQRTNAQCDEITEKVGRERLIDLVANPAITGFTLPKLLWVRENEPENWKRVRSIMLPKDYVRLKLTGVRSTDVADASGTLLFNVRGRDWSDEMISLMDLDRSLLPPVSESIEVTGRISAEGSEATGLAVGTPVVAGAGDNAAGAIGMGICLPGCMSVTIGTSGVVFVVTEKPMVDPKGRTHTLCHAIPDRWHMTGVTLSAGFSLKWFRQNFGCNISFEDLDKEASAVSAGSDGVLWLPYLMGERTPHLDANARGAFVGLSGAHGREHLTRAIMEGVAYSLKDSMEIFASLGISVSETRLGGGGARSPLWRKIQAGVYERPVVTIDVDEGAALGAAILAGVGAGGWDSVDEACTAAVRTNDPTGPDEAELPAYKTGYERYRLLYPALKGTEETPHSTKQLG